jgi:hypothetical protein
VIRGALIFGAGYLTGYVRSDPKVAEFFRSFKKAADAYVEKIDNESTTNVTPEGETPR